MSNCLLKKKIKKLPAAFLTGWVGGGGVFRVEGGGVGEQCPPIILNVSIFYNCAEGRKGKRKITPHPPHKFHSWRGGGEGDRDWELLVERGQMKKKC